MLLTPTYHVFDMYQGHRGAMSVKTRIESPNISFAAGEEKRQLPALLGSASVSANALLLTVVNPHASLPVEAAICLREGQQPDSATATVLTHEDLAAHNTFNAPQTLRPIAQRIRVASQWRHLFPPRSITALHATLIAR